jgi:adenine/guanine phosphoribosyltransferase-like PRPP-binding protein
MSLPELRDKLPYIPRESIPPPQRRHAHKTLDYELALRALQYREQLCDLTLGQATFLKALLPSGAIVRFGEEVGLDYAHVFKLNFDIQAARPMIREMAQSLRGQVDAVLLHEMSGLVPGMLLAQELGDLPVVRVRKSNGNEWPSESVFGFRLTSYTGGQEVIHYTQASQLQTLARLYPQGARLLSAEDIIDTGAMTKGTKEMIDQAVAAGFALHYVGVAALLTKGYTQAASKLAERGIKVVSGGILIEDIWLATEGYTSGMKVFGLPFGVSFAR